MGDACMVERFRTFLSSSLFNKFNLATYILILCKLIFFSFFISFCHILLWFLSSYCSNLRSVLMVAYNYMKGTESFCVAYWVGWDNHMSRSLSSWTSSVTLLLWKEWTTSSRWMCFWSQWFGCAVIFCLNYVIAVFVLVCTFYTYGNLIAVVYIYYDFISLVFLGCYIALLFKYCLLTCRFKLVASQRFHLTHCQLIRFLILYSTLCR